LDTEIIAKLTKQVQEKKYRFIVQG